MKLSIDIFHGSEKSEKQVTSSPINEFNYPIFALFESQFTKGRLNKEGLIASELTCPNLIVHFLIIMK